MMGIETSRPEQARIHQVVDEALAASFVSIARRLLSNSLCRMRIRRLAFAVEFSLSPLPRLPWRYLSVSISKSSKPPR